MTVNNYGEQSLPCLMTAFARGVEYCKTSLTHIDVEMFVLEDRDWLPFGGCVPVDFLHALIPLDRVQSVTL